MSTWKIGDSWITTNGLAVGIGSGKMASAQEAHERKAAQDTAPKRKRSKKVVAA